MISEQPFNKMDEEDPEERNEPLCVVQEPKHAHNGALLLLVLIAVVCGMSSFVFVCIFGGRQTTFEENTTQRLADLEIFREQAVVAFNDQCDRLTQVTDRMDALTLMEEGDSHYSD